MSISSLCHDIYSFRDSNDILKIGNNGFMPLIKTNKEKHTQDNNNL